MFKRQRIKRAIVFLIVLMLYLIPSGMTVFAATSDVTPVADSDSSDTYITSLLGGGTLGSQANPSGTRYAGRVWSDKTVVANNSSTSSSSYTLDLPTDGINSEVDFDSDFLHEFSVLGSSQAPSTETVPPLDVVITIDVSSSMGETVQDSTSFNDTRIKLTSIAFNNAVKYLMTTGNPNNRVALIIYGGYESLVLPLDRYTALNNSDSYNIMDATAKANWNSTTNNSNFSFSIQAQTENNVQFNFTTLERRGFTNYQSALYEVAQVFGKTNYNDLIVQNPDTGEYQSRIPVVMAMTDGASNTVCSTNNTILNGETYDNRFNTEGSYNGNWFTPTQAFANSNFSSLENSTYFTTFYMIGNRFNSNSWQNGSGTILTDVMTGSLMKSWIDNHYSKAVSDYNSSNSANVETPTSQIYTLGIGIESTLMNEADDSGWGVARLLATLNPQDYFTNNLPEDIEITIGGTNSSGYSSVLSQAAANLTPAEGENAKYNYTKQGTENYNYGYIWNSGITNTTTNGYTWSVREGQYGYPQANMITEAYRLWNQWSSGSSTVTQIEITPGYASYSSSGELYTNDIVDAKMPFNQLNSDFHPYIYNTNGNYGLTTDAIVSSDTISKQDIIDNINYVPSENFSDSETAEQIINAFTTPLQEVTNKFFIPISGNNASDYNTDNDSYDYTDPIGQYMEIKEVNNLLLFGELYDVNYAGTYDSTISAPGWILDDTSYGNSALPSGFTGTVNEAFEAGYRNYLSFDNAKNLIPSLSQDTITSTYDAYQIVPEEGSSIDTNLWNPCYGPSPNNLAQLTPDIDDGVYQLSEFYIWTENTTETSDDSNYTLENQTFYLDIPVAAIPLQIAQIYEYFCFKDNSTDLQSSYSYVTNLGADNDNQVSYYRQSTPLRVFYSVGMRDSVLNDDNEINLATISPDYIDDHRDDKGEIYFLSNYYSGDKVADIAGDENNNYLSIDSTIGNPYTTFSPDIFNRYYIFRSNKILYYIGTPTEDPTEQILENQYTEENSLTVNGQTYYAVSSLDQVDPDSWYYIVLDYYQEEINRTNDNAMSAVKQYLAIPRKGSEFGTGVGGTYGQYLTWYDPDTGDTENFEQNQGPSSSGYYLATKIGGLRTGDMLNNIQYYSDSTTTGGYYNNTDTAEIYYFPYVYETGDVGSTAEDVILNTNLGNNGKISVAVTSEPLDLDGTKYYQTVGGQSLTITADQFNFALQPADSNNSETDPVPTLDGYNSDQNYLPLTNNSNGLITIFDNLEFTSPGTYIYLLYEIPDESTSITYSDEVYTITVVVAYENNYLVPTITSITNKDGEELVDTTTGITDTTITFKNIYNPDAVSVSLNGLKAYQYGTLEDGQFSFTIQGSATNPANDPLKTYTSENYNATTNTLTVTNASSGQITFFDDLTFDKDCIGYSYTYIISEVKGSNENVTYDSESYTVTYAVSENAQGEIVVSRTITNSSGQTLEEPIASLEFENTLISKTETYPGNGKTVVEGETIEYSIYWSNDSDEAKEITIVDPIDSGLTYVSSSTPGTLYTNSSLDSFITSPTNPNYKYTDIVVWELGEQEPGSEGTVTLTVTVNSQGAGQEILYNTSYVNEVQTNTVSNPTSQTNQHKVETDPGDTIAVNNQQNVTYEISYENNSSQTSTVVIKDPLDVGVTYVSSSNNGTYDQEETLPNNLSVDYSYKGIVTWTIENVPAGGTGTVTLTVSVNEANVVNDIIHDQAFVSYVNGVWYPTEEPTNPVNNSEEPHKTEVSPGDGVGVGNQDTITYQISYFNNTSQPTTVSIEDPLDIGLIFVCASNNGVYNSNGTLSTGLDVDYSYNGIVTWTIENVPANSGGSVTLTVKVNSASVIDELVQNQAFVKNGNGSWVETEEPENPLNPGGPHKTEVSPGNGSYVQVGDQVIYTISYTNYSSNTADITIVDPLDIGLTFISATDNGVYSASGELPNGLSVDYKYSGVVTWTIANVPSGESGSVTLTVTVNDNAEDENIVYNQAFVQVGNNEWDDTEEPNNPLNGPHKTEVSPGNNVSVAVNDVITYSISYINTSDSSSTVTIIDPLDEGNTFVSASNGGTYYSSRVLPSGLSVDYSYNGVVVWTIENVPAGGSGNVTLTVSVNSLSFDNEDVINQAFVSINNGVWQETEKVINPILINPEITIEKEQSLNNGIKTKNSLTVNSGDIITYYLTITNVSSSVATNVIASDSIPNGLLINSSSISNGGTVNNNTVIWNLGTLEPGESVIVSFSCTVPVTNSIKTWTNTGIVDFFENTEGEITSNKVTATNTIKTVTTNNTTTNNVVNKSPKTGIEDMSLILGLVMLTAGILLIRNSFKTKKKD